MRWDETGLFQKNFPEKEILPTGLFKTRWQV